MKQNPSSISIDAYSREIKTYLVKGYKYLRTVKQFHEQEEPPHLLITRFIKKLKTSKRLNALTLKAGGTSEISIKSQVIYSLLRIQSQKIKYLNIAGVSHLFTHSQQSPVSAMKNLQALCTSNTKVQMRHLHSLQNLKYVFIDLRDHEIRTKQLYSILSGLKSLKTISLLPNPSTLSDTLETLNKFSESSNRSININIATKTDQEYISIPSFNPLLKQKITTLRLQYIKESSFLDGLFMKPLADFSHLKRLKLEFVFPNLKLMPYLEYLEEFMCLEQLSLYFTECWCKDFSEQVILNVRFPSSLKELKIRMSLSLQDLIIKNKALLTEKGDETKEFPWRDFNLFEDEPLFTTFYQTIQRLDSLDKLSFNLEMLEPFNSHYTNFFVSILERLPYLLYMTISVSNPCDNQQLPEYCDLALMLNACNNMKHLEHMEIYMPNFIFENAHLGLDLMNLKAFNLGITESEEQEPIKFQNISKFVKEVLKTLSQNADRITSLILDFGEIIDEFTLRRRFMMIEKFTNIEFLGLKVIITQCDCECVKMIGRVLQSFQKLHTLVLGFVESDKSTVNIKPYLKYHKSLRDVLVTNDQSIWIRSDNDNTGISEEVCMDALYDGDDDSHDSISDTFEADLNFR